MARTDDQEGLRVVEDAKNAAISIVETFIEIVLARNVDLVWSGATDFHRKS